MPEVAGDAALLIDPQSVSSISAALKQLAENQELRAQLAQKGLERAKMFNWKDTSELLWKSIERIHLIY